MPAIAKKEKYCATTVRIPKPIYEEAREAIDAGSVDVDSLNDLLVESLEKALRAVREKGIDDAFAEMGSDEDYQRSAVQLVREFERSDWDAFNAGEIATGESAGDKESQGRKASTA